MTIHTLFARIRVFILCPFRFCSVKTVETLEPARGGAILARVDVRVLCPV